MGNGSSGAGSLIRDTEQFAPNQTILSWATTVLTNTEKSIYENVPIDAPTDSFTGIVLVRILSPEEKIRIVTAYGTSGDDIYYRVAITGAISSWISPWRDIVNGSEKIGGFTADEIYNKTKSLSDYITNIGSDDIRTLIGYSRIPSGEYIINASDEGYHNSGLPVSSGIVHLTVSSVTTSDDIYYATLALTTEANVPSRYICSIYNNTKFTSWLDVGSGGSVSGPVDSLGTVTRIPIPLTSNLNEYINDGAFFVENDEIMQGIYHRPCDICGYLNVRHTSPDVIGQEFVSRTFRIWSRYYNTLTGIWSDWVYVYNSSDNLSATATNGVHIGETPPELETMLWVDTANSAALKYYDSTTKTWQPCSMAWA